MTADPDAVFWSRVADMPPWEAEQELVARRIWASEQRAEAERALVDARRKGRASDADRCGKEIQALCTLFTALNERIGYLRKLQDKMQWKHAVRALYGDDAYEACVLWIEQQFGEQSDQRREWAKKARELAR